MVVLVVNHLHLDLNVSVEVYFELLFFSSKILQVYQIGLFIYLEAYLITQALASTIFLLLLFFFFCYSLFSLISIVL